MSPIQQILLGAVAVAKEVEPFYGDRGVWGGGKRSGDNQSSQITYRSISTTYTGNTTFGNLTLGRNELSACSNGTRGCFVGGYFTSSGGGADDYSHTIDYITIASTGNATDFGDLTYGRSGMPATFSGDGRGVTMGGFAYNSEGKYIEYFTISTTGNASSFGQTASAQNYEYCGGMSNGTRGLMGGENPASNVIEYVTIATTGNASDFGDLTVARYNMGSAGNDTRGIFYGGKTSSNSNVIDYVTIDTTGNATDFGNTATKESFAGTTNGTLGIFQGDASSYYITMATTGNATDNGDLSSTHRRVKNGCTSG